MRSKYSIKDLEHLSGIKAHTIRAWESRYGVIKPQRTVSNIRYYNDADLQKILNVSTLLQSGFKISKVCEMSEEEVRLAVMNSGRYESNFLSYINTLKAAMLEYNEMDFDAVISRCIVTYGAERTMMEVVGPFIKEVGLLWQIGAIGVSHEHFASNLLRMKLYSLIEQNFNKSSGSNKDAYILYLPADELHELSLLYLYYHLKAKGHRVIYLGQAVPLEYVKDVSDRTGVRNFISVLTTKPNTDELEAYLKRIVESFRNTGSNFLLTGTQLKGVQVPDGDSTLRILIDVEELKACL